MSAISACPTVISLCPPKLRFAHPLQPPGIARLAASLLTAFDEEMDATTSSLQRTMKRLDKALAISKGKWGTKHFPPFPSFP